MTKPELRVIDADADHYAPPTLLGSEVRVMTQEETSCMMQTIMAHKSNPAFSGDAIHMMESYEDSLEMSERILLAWLKRHNIKITGELACMILRLSRSPGDIVLWLWTLHNMTPANGELLTMIDWVNAFPVGVPTDESLSRCWDAQKHPKKGYNLLDQSITWQKPEARVL